MILLSGNAVVGKLNGLAILLTISTILLHPLNAFSAIEVRLAGNVIIFKPVHP